MNLSGCFTVIICFSLLLFARSPLILALVAFAFYYYLSQGRRVRPLFEGRIFDAEEFENFFKVGPDDPEKVFFECYFSLAAKIAKADGRVTEAEINFLERFMQQELSLSDEKIHKAQEIFRKAKESNISVNEYASRFYYYFKRQPPVLFNMLSALSALAESDKRISPAEFQILSEISEIFGIPVNRFARQGSSFDSEFKRPRGRTYSDSSSDLYSVIGASPNMSDEELKKAYRKAVRENHPDRAIGKGLPPEFIKTTTERFKVIQAAWEEICVQRGIS